MIDQLGFRVVYSDLQFISNSGHPAELILLQVYLAAGMLS